MRVAIFWGLVMVAEAINPNHVESKKGYLLGCMFILLLYDIVEFLTRKRKPL